MIIRHILYITLLLAYPAAAQAQFLGGDGGGTHALRSPAIACGSLGIFNGTTGGGATRYIRLPLIACEFSMSFTGGSGGGAADTLIRNSPLDCDFFGSSSSRGSGHSTAMPPVSPLECDFFGSTSSTGGGHSTAMPPFSPLACDFFGGSEGSGHYNIDYLDAIDDGDGDMVWLGTVSDDWFDPDNWTGCDRIPSCARNVIIQPATFQPLINAPDASCNNITIRGSASLSMAVDYNLDVCGHWLNNGALMMDAGASVTMVGVADQDMTGNMRLVDAFATLIIDKPSGYVRLQDTVHVLDTLSLQRGIVLTEDRRISLLGHAPDALKPGYSALSYIHGNLRRYVQPTGMYHFPVGDTLVGYELATVDFTEPTSIDLLDARFDPFPVLPIYTNPLPECGNNGYDNELLNNGFWTLDALPAAVASTGRYNMTLHNVGYTNEQSSFTVAKRPTGTAGTGGWDLDGFCDGSSTADVVRRTAMQGFSEFATAQGDVPFPLDKLQLQASAQADHIQLNWLSDELTDAPHFQLLRGDTPNDLSLLTTLQADAEGQLQHSYADHAVQRGHTYFYQVLRLDADGGHTRSNLAQGILPSIQRFVYSIYPNPVSDKVQLTLAATDRTPVTVHIHNQLGQRIYNEKHVASERQATHVIHTTEWAAGVYYVTLNAGKEMDTIKLVKLRQ